MKILLCVFSLFVLLSCNKMAPNDMRDLAAAPPMMEGSYVMADAEVVEETVAMDESVRQNVPAPKAVIDRKLIKNGSLSFEVKDVTSVNSEITLLIVDAGGYIASERQHHGDDHPTYELIARIPGERLDDFVSKVESLATKIEDKNFSTQDVTEEFVDLESRLIAKREVEARYREIVKQARNVNEVLSVEDQIGNVRAEIETIQGRLKYLSNKVSYSTVTLSYHEPVTIVVPGTGSKFAESFVGGWNGFVTFLVALTATWPFLVVLGAVAWLVIRRRRKEPKVIAQPQ